MAIKTVHTKSTLVHTIKYETLLSSHATPSVLCSPSVRLHIVARRP